MGNSYLWGSRAFLHQRIHQGQPPLVSDLKVHQHKDFPFRCCYCVPKQDVNQTLVILKSNYLTGAKQYTSKMYLYNFNEFRLDVSFHNQRLGIRIL